MPLITCCLPAKTATRTPPHTELQNLITEISNGKLPPRYSHLLENSRSGVNNPLATRAQNLSPLQKLYFSLRAVNDKNSLSDATNMIALQTSTKCCWFGNNETRLVINNQTVSSSKEDGFYLVAQLFSDSGSISTIEIDTDNTIIIDLPHNSGKKAALKAYGEIYVGDFASGKKHGEGTIIYPNGDTFIGTFENGHRKNGTVTCLNGDTFTGSFKNGKFENGKGKRTYDDGVFEGAFKNGERENGVLVHKDLTSLVLESGRLKSGPGEFQYPNGDIFNGSFIDGKRKSGTIICKNGDEFSGNFSNGIPRDGALTVDKENLNLRASRTVDEFMTRIIEHAIEKNIPSFVEWYAERFVPGKVYPKSTLNEIITDYQHLTTKSTTISTLKLPTPATDIISHHILIGSTKIVVIKTKDSNKNLEIYPLKYFLDTMTIYIKDLINGTVPRPFSVTPLSRTNIMPNIVPPSKISEYANSFAKGWYGPIATPQTPEPAPALRIDPSSL